MIRTRRVHVDVTAAYRPAVQQYLLTGNKSGPPEDVLQILLLDGQFDHAWKELGAGLLTTWIRRRPGTRPWAWWEFEAPQTAVGAKNRPAFRTLVAQRARLGGIGTPAHEVLGHAAWFRFGLPVVWVTAFDQEYYNGRLRDIHGCSIGTEYHDGDFAGVAPNVDDPPRFESQAAFLDRLGLLGDGERRRLSVNAFKADVIDCDDDSLAGLVGVNCPATRGSLTRPRRLSVHE